MRQFKRLPVPTLVCLFHLCNFLNQNRLTYQRKRDHSNTNLSCYRLLGWWSSIVHSIVPFMILVPYMEQANLIKDSMGTAIEKVLLSFVTLTRIKLGTGPLKSLNSTLLCSEDRGNIDEQQQLPLFRIHRKTFAYIK